MENNELTHISKDGHVRMVDVSHKAPTVRRALASGQILMQPRTLKLIMENGVAKGNVFETARIAGIMAAKKTWELIPMCHPLEISHISVSFLPDVEKSTIEIRAEARVTGRTGIEMEALCAVSVAGLTIYDMCKAVDKKMIISRIRLLEKDGGKSGPFRVDAEFS